MKAVTVAAAARTPATLRVVHDTPPGGPVRDAVRAWTLHRPVHDTNQETRRKRPEDEARLPVIVGAASLNAITSTGVAQTQGTAGLVELLTYLAHQHLVWAFQFEAAVTTDLKQAGFVQ